MSRPMTTSCKLSKDDESPSVGATLYRLVIVTLLSLTTSWPEIMQLVGMVARFQSTPIESHLMVVKIFLRYLKGTPDYRLWYPKRTTLTLTTYTDAN